MAQTVRSRTYTAEVLIRSQISPFDVCGAQSGTVTGFSHSTSVSPVSISPTRSVLTHSPTTEGTQAVDCVIQ